MVGSVRINNRADLKELKDLKDQTEMKETENLLKIKMSNLSESAWMTNSDNSKKRIRNETTIYLFYFFISHKNQIK